MNKVNLDLFNAYMNRLRVKFEILNVIMNEVNLEIFHGRIYRLRLKFEVFINL